MPFNLDVAIDTWLSMLKRRKPFFADDMEELERHLRDHTAHLIGRGLSEEDAFRKAREHIGDFVFLEKAYQNVFWRKLIYHDLFLKNLLIQLSMIGNYLKLAVRNLARHKGLSALNIAGLAVGLACSFLIFLWIQEEVNVDQFHEKGDRIYHVKTNAFGGDRITTWPNASARLAETLKSTFPELETAVLNLPVKTALRRDGKASRERGYFASPDFFTLFTFPLIAGDPASALTDPASIVISESVAAKFFGSDWRTDDTILGQTLTMDYWESAGGVLGEAMTINNQKEFTITGIFEAVPTNSTLQFDVIAPVAEVIGFFPHLANWGPRWFELIIGLRPDADARAFGEKIRNVLKDNIPGGERQELILQPFRDTYLYDAFESGRPAGGRIEQVYLIGLVGLAILLIACINFTNLVTARSNQRALEIGIRKAMGATPSVLTHQFLGEAILTAFFAFVCAIGLTVALLPVFKTVTGTDLMVSSLTASNWLSFLGIALLTGLVAGSYPAYYLASLNVVNVFRNRRSARKRGQVSARKGLVVLQFALSSFLIVGALTVYQQLNFLQTRDVGLDQHDVAMIRLQGEMATQYESVRQALLVSPAIEDVSLSSAHPVGVAIKNQNVIWEGKDPDESILFTVLETDDRFASTMKLPLVEGRFFDETRDRNALSFVVNEAAVQAMGLQNPVGHPFAFGYDEERGGLASGRIVGVVKNFNTGSLKDEQIGPVAFRYQPSGNSFLLARLTPENIAPGLEALAQVQERFNPGYPLEYSFLDETYRAYYTQEAVLGQLSRIFAFVAVFIACLGLFGLSAYSVQERTREIGVRRVLGASVLRVTGLLSLEFVILVAIALVISLPLAYWAMNSWLQSFAFRIELGGGTLFIAAALAIAVAVFTVGYQALRASHQDPITAIRSE
jgi:putative ABC transport system permease protein